MPRSYGTTNVAPYTTPPPVGPAGDTYYNTGLKALFLSDGTAWNQVTGPPSATPSYGARIRRSSDQSIPNATWTSLVFSTVVEETNLGASYFSGSNIVIPPGLGGRYVLTSHLRWEAAATASAVLLVTVNGAGVVRDAPVATASGYLELQCSCVWTLNAGDVVGVVVSHGSGAARNVSAISAGGGTDPAGPVLEVWRIEGLKGDKGDPGGAQTMGSVALTNRLNNTPGSWIDWGSAGVPVTTVPVGTANATVFAQLTGAANDFTTAGTSPVLFRLACSFDGGSTWNYTATTESAPMGQVSPTFPNRTVFASSYQWTQAAVTTGQVQIKAQVQSASGGNAVNFLNGQLTWSLITGSAGGGGKGAVFRYAGTDPTSFSAGAVIPMNTLHEVRNVATAIANTSGTGLGYDFYSKTDGYVYVGASGWYMVTARVMTGSNTPAAGTWLSLTKTRNASDGSEAETTGQTQAGRDIFPVIAYAPVQVVWSGWLAAGDRLGMSISATMNLGVPPPNTVHGNDPYSPQMTIVAIGNAGPAGGGALGIVAWGSSASGNGTACNPSTPTAVSGTINFTPLIGRRYKIAWGSRAISGPVGLYIVLWNGGAVDTTIDPSVGDWYISTERNYGSATIEFFLNGDGVARAWTMMATGNSSVYNGHFYIEDMGPNSTPALPVSAVPPAWTDLVVNLNGWYTPQGAGQPVAQYRKIGDIVYLRGTIAGGTLNQPAFILPAGFRPQQLNGQVVFNVVIGSQTFGSFVVNNDGSGILQYSNNQYANLSPVFFSTTP